jgi:hypothetical protein
MHRTPWAVTIAALLLFSTPARAGEGWDTKLVVKADFEIGTPRMWNPHVTWSARVQGEMQIFLYNIRTGVTQQITKGKAGSYFPQVQGNFLAYGTGHDLMVYDIQKETHAKVGAMRLQPDANLTIPSTHFSMGGDWVAYLVEGGVQTAEVFVYDVKTGQTVQCTTGGKRRTSVTTDGKWVAWCEGRGDGSDKYTILAHNPASRETINASGNGDWSDMACRLRQGILAWHRRHSGYNADVVHVYDMAKKTSQQVTLPKKQSMLWDFDGKRVIWYGHDWGPDPNKCAPPVNHEVFVFDIQTGKTARLSARKKSFSWMPLVEDELCAWGEGVSVNDGKRTVRIADGLPVALHDDVVLYFTTSLDPKVKGSQLFVGIRPPAEVAKPAK